MTRKFFFKKWDTEIKTLKSIRKKMITKEAIEDIDSFIRVISTITNDVKKIKP